MDKIEKIKLIEDCLNKLEKFNNWQFYGLKKDSEHDDEENCYEVTVSFADVDSDEDREWKVWFYVDENDKVLIDICEAEWIEFSEAEFFQQLAYRIGRGYKGEYHEM